LIGVETGRPWKGPVGTEINPTLWLWDGK